MSDGSDLTRELLHGDGPLHANVADYIREKVYSKQWGVGEALPSEHELAAMLA